MVQQNNKLNSRIEELQAQLKSNGQAQQDDGDKKVSTFRKKLAKIVEMVKLQGNNANLVHILEEIDQNTDKADQIVYI